MNSWIAVVLPLAIAYASAGLWIWEMWWIEDSYYSHGPLMVAAAAFGIWDRRERWQALPCGTDSSAWILLGLGLLLHLAGVALTVDSLSAISLLLTLPGACWLVLGRARTMEILSALMVFAFAVPPPLRVTGELVFRLKEFAIARAIDIANVGSETVLREGHRLRVVLPDDGSGPRSTWLVVADECGGLRSLLSLVAVGYCLAFLFGPRRGWRPWVLLLLAGPVAILANVLRVTGLCWAARWEFDSDSAHTVMNLLEWVFALGMLGLVDWGVFRRRNDTRGSRS